MASARKVSREVTALLFFAGYEIGYQVNGSGCSSPQTTELRVGGKEGDGAAESTLMKWVHKSSATTLLVTGLMSIFAGNPAAFLGGLLSVLDMEASYQYAKACGHRLRGGGSRPGKGSPSERFDVPQQGRRPRFERP